jgi:Ser/Thr protein kinase RdoA (MazF antagonist)
MNKKSSLYKELSLIELSKIINHHFDETDFEAELLSGGLFNTTYRISLPEKKIILRVGPVNTQLLLPFENNLMRAEEYVYKLLGNAQIPCSHVIACDTSKTLIGRDYMIVDCIAGKPLSEIEVTADIKAGLYRQVGMYARKIHNITSAKFGRVSEVILGNGYSAWGEYLSHEMSDLCGKLSEYSILSSDEISMCRSVTDRYFVLLNEIKTPRLVHADLWAGNILVKQNGESYEVAAIIDADRAVFGDTGFEFASPWIINEPFISGYGPIGEQNENTEIRKNIYRLFYSLIDAYVWSVEYNNPENSANNKENSLKLLGKLLNY